MTSALLKAKNGSALGDDSGPPALGEDSGPPEVGVIEHASAHLIGHDNSPADGLFKRAGAGDGCFDGFPVDGVLGEVTVPESAAAFLATTSSTNWRTRSNDPMPKESVAESGPARSAPSGWEQDPDVIVDGQSCDARASVVRVVGVCKALFTIFGACGAIRTAGARSDRDLVQSPSGTPEDRIDFGHPSFVVGSQHGIQSAQFLEQLMVHRGEAGDCRLQLPGGPCRGKCGLLGLPPDLVRFLRGFGEDLSGLCFGLTENLVNLEFELGQRSLGEPLCLDEESADLELRRFHPGSAVQPGVGLLEPALQLLDGAGDGVQFSIGPFDFGSRRLGLCPARQRSGGWPMSEIGAPGWASLGRSGTPNTESIGLVLISTLSYPRPRAIDKSELQGFASRSCSRKTGNAHVTLGICLVDGLGKTPSGQGAAHGGRGAPGRLQLDRTAVQQQR